MYASFPKDKPVSVNVADISLVWMVALHWHTTCVSPWPCCCETGMWGWLKLILQNHIKTGVQHLAVSHKTGCIIFSEPQAQKTVYWVLMVTNLLQHSQVSPEFTFICLCCLNVGFSVLPSKSLSRFPVMCRQCATVVVCCRRQRARCHADWWLWLYKTCLWFTGEPSMFSGIWWWQ